jgi:cytochrome c oxidase subunit 3
MMFAGLTSAFVVSKSRADWLKDFQLPTAFSTVAIIGCSVTLFGKKSNSKNNQSKTTLFLVYTSTRNIVCSFAICRIYK